MHIVVEGHVACIYIYVCACEGEWVSGCLCEFYEQTLSFLVPSCFMFRCSIMESIFSVHLFFTTPGRNMFVPFKPPSSCSISLCPVFHPEYHIGKKNRIPKKLFTLAWQGVLTHAKEQMCHGQHTEPQFVGVLMFFHVFVVLLSNKMSSLCNW